MKKKLLLMLCFLSGYILISPSAKADSIHFSGDVKAQAVSTDDNDLGTLDEGGTDSQSLQARLRAFGNFSDTMSFYTEGRGVLNYGEGGGEDPITGESLGAKDFLELREAWLQTSNLFNQTPLSLRAGRQRIRDPYGLWWNRNFDAVRFLYDTTLFKGFLGVGENLFSYRTSGEDFTRDDEDIFRVLGEASWQWRYNHFFETRFLYQDDHSGIEDVGTIVEADDRDDNDARLFWGGVRFAGRLPHTTQDTSKYRIDFLGVAGEEEAVSTTVGSPGFRVVTGSQDQDVLGWAMDAGVDVTLPLSFQPVLILGYAFGSGDDDPTDGTNNAFRQSGLHSNYGYPGISTSGVHNYGSVFRPELSNLHVLTASIGAPVFSASNLSFIYHYYSLAHEDGGLISSGIRAPLSGTSHDLGQGADIILNVNVSQELDLKLPQEIKGIDFRTTLGAFQSGDAYGAASDEVAMRGLMELRVRF